MSLRIFDFECESKECSLSFQPVELMVHDYEHPVCDECGFKLRRLPAAPFGRVSTYNAFAQKRKIK